MMDKTSEKERMNEMIEAVMKVARGDYSVQVELSGKNDDLDYVRIYISHLRQKIEPDSTKPKYILTEPGVGYYFQKSG